MYIPITKILLFSIILATLLFVQGGASSASSVDQVTLSFPPVAAKANNVPFSLGSQKAAFNGTLKKVTITNILFRKAQHDNGDINDHDKDGEASNPVSFTLRCLNAAGEVKSSAEISERNLKPIRQKARRTNSPERRVTYQFDLIPSDLEGTLVVSKGDRVEIEAIYEGDLNRRGVQVWAVARFDRTP